MIETVTEVCTRCGGAVRVPIRQAYQMWHSSWQHKYAEDCRAVIAAELEAARAGRKA